LEIGIGLLNLYKSMEEWAEYSQNDDYRLNMVFIDNAMIT